MTDISSQGMPAAPADASQAQPADSAQQPTAPAQAGPQPAPAGSAPNTQPQPQTGIQMDANVTPMTAAQKQAVTVATKSPNPIAQHVHDVAETLTGGPQTRYTTNPDGTIASHKVPVSTAHLGLALALEVLRGGLTGASGNRYTAGQRGLEEGKQQAAQQRQAQIDSLNAANTQSEAQVRALGITKANLELHQMALNVGKQDEATNRAMDATYAPVMKDLEENHPDAILTKVPEWGLQDALKKYNVTKDMAVPYDTIPVLDAKTGEQAKHADGTPVWGHMYAIVNPGIKTTLSDETQTMGYNIGQFKSPDGSQVQMGNPNDWPLSDIISRHTKYAQINVAEGLLNKQIADLKGIGEGKEGPKLNLADQVRQDPTLLSAVEDYSKYAGVGDFDQIIYTMGQSKDPSEKQSAARLMQFAGVTSDELEKAHNDRVQAAAEAAKPKQATPLTPEDAQLKLSEVAHTDAETRKLNADTDKLLKDNNNADAIVDAIGNGHVSADRLGYILARKPELIDAVVTKYPDFDSSKAAAYPDVYKQFTSTKNGTAGGALNAGGTALTHLQELKALNTEASQIPGTPSWTAYQNKADTVASELAKFYGDATIPAIASIKDTLASKLVMNRNAAIRTQAKSMGDKLDAYEQQWKNAAPSKAYEAPMPQITDKAKAARAVLDPDGYGKRSGMQPANPAVKGLVIH